MGSGEQLRNPLFVVAAAWLASAGACATEDVVARQADACVQDCEPRSDADICGVEALPTGDTACEAEGRAHRYALCVCEDYVGQQPLRVEGDGESQGSMGVNGAFHTGAELQLGGSLQVSGEGDITASGDSDLVIGGDLESASGVSGASLSVGGDARVGGDIRLSDLSIGGTLRQPDGATRSVSGTQDVTASERGSVNVPPPCDCDATRPDLGAAVRAHRSDNDNARLGLSAFVLDGFTEPQSLELSCGSYHLSRIAGADALELHVEGDVALYVDGDVALDDAFRVELAPGARLWLTVEQSFRVSGALELGGPEGDGRVHLRVAGAGTLQLGGASLVVGSLYAPEAELVTQGELEVRGALLVRRAALEGRTTVVYDSMRSSCSAPQ